jgi:hypothetical protein
MPAIWGHDGFHFNMKLRAPRAKACPELAEGWEPILRENDATTNN